MKKKFLFGSSVLLVLLFGTFFATCSTCYASISSEYFDYAISTMAENCVYNNTTYQNKARTKLRNLSGDSVTKTAILNNINSKLASANKSTLSDAQCIFNVSTMSSSTFTISIYFYNNTVPGGNDELTFFRVINNYIKSNSYETGDTAYYMIVTLEYTGSWVGYTDLYTTNGNMTMNTLNSSFTATDLDFYKLTIDSCACYGVPVGYAQSPLDSTNNVVQVFLYDKNGNFKIPEPEPEPEPTPSGDNGLGNITTPSGDNGGNINLQPIQDSLNRIEEKIPTSGDIQNILSGEVEKIISSETDITSSDISGDFSSMLGSTENVVDPTTNFFSWLIDNIRTILNSTGNYDLKITLFDTEYTIRSDFFVLPEGSFRDFLQMAFVAWFGWSIIKKIRYIVYAVKCVNITDALHQVDFNPNLL